MVNIVPISVVLTSNTLHHNSVGITYARASNFKMESIISIPLYSLAMFQSMVTIIEAPFVIAPAHTVVGMRFRP